MCVAFCSVPFSWRPWPMFHQRHVQPLISVCVFLPQYHQGGQCIYWPPRGKVFAWYLILSSGTYVSQKLSEGSHLWITWAIKYYIIIAWHHGMHLQGNECITPHPHPHPPSVGVMQAIPTNQYSPLYHPYLIFWDNPAQMENSVLVNLITISLDG